MKYGMYLKNGYELIHLTQQQTKEQPVKFFASIKTSKNTNYMFDKLKKSQKNISQKLSIDRATHLNTIHTHNDL